MLGTVLNPDWQNRLETEPMYYLLRNSMAPVALFDKEYDREGGDQYFNKEWPGLVEGTDVRKNIGAIQRRVLRNRC